MATGVTPEGFRQLDHDRGTDPNAPWSLSRILFGSDPERDYRGIPETSTPEVVEALAVVGDQSVTEPCPELVRARAAERKRTGRVATIEEIEALCEKMAERAGTPEYQAALQADREWGAALEEANRQRWAARNSNTKPDQKRTAQAEARAMKADGRAGYRDRQALRRLAPHHLQLARSVKPRREVQRARVCNVCNPLAGVVATPFTLVPRTQESASHGGTDIREGIREIRRDQHRPRGRPPTQTEEENERCEENQPRPNCDETR